MSAARGLHLLALLAPPIVIAASLGVLAEVGLRLQRFGPDAVTSPFEYMAPAWRDTDCFKTGPKGELMTPNCRMPYKGVAIETNSAGLNDREVDESQPHYRIAVLGDSVSMAAGVARPEIYHAILEDRLNAELGATDFVELYNFGRGGRSTVDEVEDFQSALARWPLDAAMVAITPGNLWANLLNPKSCEPATPDEALSEQELQWYLKRMKGENLASTVLTVGERNTGLWSFHVPRDFFRALTQRFASQPDDRERISALERKALAKFRTCARHMRAIADAASIELGWVVLWYRPDRQAEMMRHELKQLGELVTTTMGVHEHFASTEEMIIYAREVHPNAATNHRFADALHAWLGEIGWVSKIERAHQKRHSGQSAALGS